MIIREVITILEDTIYRNYSDKHVYIKNKETGILHTDVNSSIDYEYEETDIKIEIEEDKKEKLQRLVDSGAITEEEMLELLK
jgi:hypothetical protein